VSEQLIERGRNGFAATVLALLAVPVIAMATSLASHARTIKLTADMPMRSHALSQAEYDAIVAEAKDISRLTHDTRDLSHWPSQWRSGLDPARLAALWSMPQSAALAELERTVLIEQAAQWDMLAFERPSDAALLWNRLWPLGLDGRTDVAPNSTGRTLGPDANWSDNAVAMVTVFSCFPEIAWTVPGDPAVWATKHSVGWQWRNASGWDGLRDCIKETIAENAWLSAQVSASTVDNQANARLNDAVVGILKAKFTRELSQDGCKREGADSCLVVYQGLFALDRNNPQLVPILHRMERSFDLDRPIVMPTLAGDGNASSATAKPARKIRRNELTDADLQLLDTTLTEVERRRIFITLKLPIQLAHPDAWRAGDLDRTLRQAMDLTLLLERMQSAKHRNLLSDRYFSDPWQWVDGSADPAINATLRDLGAAYARSVGCDTDGLGLGTRLQAFWQGDAIEVIRAGRAVGNCRAVDALRLPEVYQAAAHEQDAAAAARDMAVFAPIEAALASDGDVRTQSLDAMTPTCAALKTPAARDPWKLCAGVAARDAQIAEAERKRVADEQARLAAIKAAQPPPDPYACGDGVVMLAVKALGYKGDADFWSREQTACRLRPENPKEAIVALTYTHGDQLSGMASDNNDNGYDLDVLIVRTEDGTVAARNAPAAHIDSDAITFTGVGIDTADYALAPGRRAFGIRAGHVSHCYACDYGQTDLRLYLLRGNKLDDILDTMMDETRGEGDGSDCNDIPTVSTRTIKVAATKAHGLADLLLTTTSAMDPDVGSVAAACKDKSKIPTASVDTIKLSFNGRAYPVPADGN
jgi:hypothetical protein